jgi:hypothetical protein
MSRLPQSRAGTTGAAGVTGTHKGAYATIPAHEAEMAQAICCSACDSQWVEEHWVPLKPGGIR